MKNTNESNDTKASKKINLNSVVKNAGTTLSNATDKAKNVVTKSKDSIVSAIDANGNGEIDIEDFIIIGLQTPGIKVNRADFLQKELMKNHPQEVIDLAISHNPAYAKIQSSEVDKIADEVIKFERNCVSGISAALGAPGGVAMVATIPADLVQYYGYMLRATQKLMYLYGFPEIDTTEKEHRFDSETMNLLIICLGVMYGVQGTNAALKAMATALGKGVEKKLMKTALTKGTI